MSDIEPKKMKVAELREELKTRGLDTKGNKAQLIKRLEKALASEEGGDDLETSQDQDTSAIDSSQDESMNESVTEQPEAESAQVEEEAAQEAEEPEAVQQIETDTKMEADTAMEEAAEPAPEGQEEQAAEGQAVQETGKEEAPAEDEQQEEATESGFPEAEQDGMEDEQQGDFQVMDAVGEDSEAPEADQKMEGGDVKEEKQDASAAAEGSSAKPSGDDKNLKRKHSPSRSDDRRDRDRDRHRRSSHRSRPRSPQHHHSRSRSKDRQPRRGYSPQRIEMEDDTEWLANTNIIIDRYNSDLNLRIEKEVKGSPITVEGFAFMWAGARANFGVNKGKVAFEVKILDQLNVDHLPPEETSRHVLRVGFSTDNTSLQLGEEPNSWGYGGTAKASTDCKFKDYGEKYGQGDVITAYVDFDSEPATIAFSKNGEDQGVCYELDKEALGGAALFPHVLTKNCEFEINYGAKEEPFFPLKEGFVFLQSLPVEERVRGSIPPAKKEDCEMIMMCGLPGAGKTYWAIKHADANRDKKYNILGTNSIIDKMKVMGLPRKKNYAGRWDVLIDKATKCLNRLFEIAARKKRNYILDQTNVYPSAQRRKMRPFEGFQRKAVVIVPSEEEFKKRTEKREKEEGKEVPDSAVLEMKANFALPEQGPLFDEVEFVELPRDEAKKLVDQYNKEGQAALPPQEKRFRYGDRDRGYGGGRYDRGRDNRGYGGYDRDNRGEHEAGKGIAIMVRDRPEGERRNRNWYGQGDRGRRQGSYMGYSQSDRDRVSGKYNRNDSRDNRGYDRNDNRSVGWGRNQGSWNQNQSGGNWNRGGWGNQGSGGWGNQGPWGNQGTWGNQGSWGNQGGWGGQQWAGYNQGSGQDQWGQGYNYNWGQGYNYNQPGGSQGSYGSGWNYGSYQNK